MKGIKISELERGNISNNVILPVSEFSESTYITKAISIDDVVNFVNGNLVAGQGISLSKTEDGKFEIRCAVDTSLYKVVESLPSIEDIEPDKIYLVPVEGQYEEWSYINDEWKLLGAHGASVSLDNYYTKDEVYNKSQVDDKVDSKVSAEFVQNAIAAVDHSNYATKTEVEAKYTKPEDGIGLIDLSDDVKVSLSKANSALQEHQSLAGYATESWVEDKHYLTSHQDISGLATKVSVEAVNAKVNSLVIPSVEGLASESFVRNEIEKINIPDVSNLASKDYVNNAIQDIATVDVSGFLTRDEIIALIQQYGGSANPVQPSEQPTEAPTGKYLWFGEYTDFPEGDDLSSIINNLTLYNSSTEINTMNVNDILFAIVPQTVGELGGSFDITFTSNGSTGTVSNVFDVAEVGDYYMYYNVNSGKYDNINIVIPE